MGEDRSWMYNGWDKSGAHSNEWVAKTKAFLDHAFSLSSIGKVRCPCNQCQNFKLFDKTEVALDLRRFILLLGFSVTIGLID